MKISKRNILIIKFLILILFLLLVVIHFLLKDRLYWISVLFYATPLPLLIVFGLLICILFIKIRMVLYPLLLLLTIMTYVYFKNYFGTPLMIDTNEDSTKILLWNVAQNDPLPTDIIIEHINDSQAKIIALVEAEHVTPEVLDRLHKACPGYQFRKLYGYMLVGVKGNIHDVEFRDASNVYKFNYITSTINQKKIQIMLVDVYAGPFLNKQIPLSIISDFIKSHPTNIVLGDFNTPYESVHFKAYKESFNSFHPYSDGCTSTWPIPLPILELDQIWIHKELQPLQLQKFSYPNSDHKLLIGTYD